MSQFSSSSTSSFSSGSVGQQQKSGSRGKKVKIYQEKKDKPKEQKENEAVEKARKKNDKMNKGAADYYEKRYQDEVKQSEKLMEEKRALQEELKARNKKIPKEMDEPQELLGELQYLVLTRQSDVVKNVFAKIIMFIMWTLARVKDTFIYRALVTDDTLRIWGEWDSLVGQWLGLERFSDLFEGPRRRTVIDTEEKNDPIMTVEGIMNYEDTTEQTRVYMIGDQGMSSSSMSSETCGTAPVTKQELSMMDMRCADMQERDMAWIDPQIREFGMLVDSEDVLQELKESKHKVLYKLLEHIGITVPVRRYIKLRVSMVLLCETLSRFSWRQYGPTMSDAITHFCMVEGGLNLKVTDAKVRYGTDVLANLYLQKLCQDYGYGTHGSGKLYIRKNPKDGSYLITH